MSWEVIDEHLSEKHSACPIQRAVCHLARSILKKSCSYSSRDILSIPSQLGAIKLLENTESRLNKKSYLAMVSGSVDVAEALSRV